MLSSGTIVAGYRIDGVLGRGGMGVVYEATQLSLDRKVALKLIAPEMGGDGALQERFRREGLRQAAIDHPHIVAVHEAGEHEHGLYFAMRLVRGPTLKDLIAVGELDVSRTMRLLSQIADALDIAHAAGLIHRDVKPQNILVGSGDHAYLADFGLTTSVGDRSLTDPGGFVGTLHYVAPEQIRGEPVSPRTDVYALTGVLYECLTGDVPYPKESDAAVLWAHVALAPPRVSENRPDLPESLDAVIDRGMAKDSQARFATAGETIRSAQRACGLDVRSATKPRAPIGGGIAAVGRGALANATTADADAPAFAHAGMPLPASVDVPSATEAHVPVRADAPPLRARSMIAAAVVVLALAVAGYVSGASRDGDGPARRPLAAGPLRLQVPASWRRTSSVPAIPGLSLSRAAAVSPGGVPGRAPVLVAGVAAGTGPTLLPGTFLDRLARRPANDDVVRLGDIAAYRYRDLQVRGLSRRATAFVVPTGQQVATVICLARAGSSSSRCEQAAATLKLDGLRALPLGPSAAYAKALNTAIAGINDRRDSARSVLRSASSPAARARAARAVSRAFADAATRLAAIDTGPYERPTHAALRDDVRRAGAAYDRLAAAARRNSVAGFKAASSSIRGHEAGIERDLQALQRLGYPSG